MATIDSLTLKATPLTTDTIELNDGKKATLGSLPVSTATTTAINAVTWNTLANKPGVIASGATQADAFSQISTAFSRREATAFIEVDGNDATGILDNPFLPFATAAAALDAGIAVEFLTLKFGTGRFAAIPGDLDYYGHTLGASKLRSGLQIIGAGAPVFNAASTGLEGGTIINGPLAFGDRNNVTVENLGVDSGSTICTENYSGTAQEGLLFFQLGSAAPYTASTISASSVDNSINDSANAFPAGYRAGSKIVISGFTGTVGNNGTATVVSRTASKIVISGITLVTDAAGESVTITKGRTVGNSINNVTTICQNASAAVHALLFENVDGGQLHNVTTRFGTHGVVFKAYNTRGSNIRASGHASNGLIIKSNHYAGTFNLVVDNVLIESVGSYDGGGVRIHSENAGMANVSLINCIAQNTIYGLRMSENLPGSYGIEDSDFDLNAYNPSTYAAEITGDRLRIRLRTFSPGAGTVTVTSAARKVDLLDLYCGNCANGVAVAGGVVRLFSPRFSNISGTAIARTGGTLYVFNPFFEDTIATKFSGTLSNDFVTITPLNSWANFGSGNPNLRVAFDGQFGRLSGLIRNGITTDGTSLGVIPAGLRPVSPIRVLAACNNAGTRTAAALVIATDGNITLDGAAPGNTWLSLDNISYPIG